MGNSEKNLSKRNWKKSVFTNTKRNNSAQVKQAEKNGDGGGSREYGLWDNASRGKGEDVGRKKKKKSKNHAAGKSHRRKKGAAVENKE